MFVYLATVAIHIATVWLGEKSWMQASLKYRAYSYIDSFKRWQGCGVCAKFNSCPNAYASIVCAEILRAFCGTKDERAVLQNVH